jgi:tetratricopeptide (TPR) repeat protein
MKKILLMAMALMFVAPVMAQEESPWGPEWGEKAEDRQTNVEAFNLLNPSIQRGEWGQAGFYLNHLLEKAPLAHPAIYSLGIRMYKQRTDAATDPAQKLVLADSLLLLHDQLLERFPDIPQAAQMHFNKATYTRQYFGDDKARVLETFRKGAEIAGSAMPSILVGYFNELTSAYKNNEVTAEEYLTEYGRLSGELTAVGATDQQGQLGQLFVSSGAADCATVEKVYAAIVDASPEDIGVLDRTIGILNLANCQGEFYMSVAEKLYNVQPTSQTAQILAVSYKAKGDTETANKFLQEAIALATTPEDKAKVLLGIAYDNMNDKNYRGMYNNANEVLKIDPKNATAQYMAAIATAGGSGGCAGLAQRAVYWLAYDRMLEARNMAANSQDNAELLQDIESNIARFAAYFPTAEELFLESINEGTGYTVNCGWVSGRTTVRHRP